MKLVTAILSYLKFVLVPPFAALVIWVFTSFSSSFVRFVVPMLENASSIFYQVADSFFASDGWQVDYAYNLGMAVQNCTYYVGNWIYGFQGWIDFGKIVNTVLSIVLIELAYVIVRFTVRLLTLFQH